MTSLDLTSEDWQSIWLTVWTAACSVLLILPLGLCVAWCLARREWWGKSIVETFVALPLVLPPVATGLILLKLFGRNGPVGSWLDRVWGMNVVFTPWAIVLALCVMAFPLMVRSLRTAIEEVPTRLEQVARTLGRGPWNVFWTVTLPLARRGIAAGIVLSFARALGEFGATIMVAGFIAGETNTLALSIYQHVQAGDDDHAMRLVIVCSIIAFIALLFSEWLLRKRRRS